MVAIKHRIVADNRDGYVRVRVEAAPPGDEEWSEKGAGKAERAVVAAAFRFAADVLERIPDGVSWCTPTVKTGDCYRRGATAFVVIDGDDKRVLSAVNAALRAPFRAKLEATLREKREAEEAHLRAIMDGDGSISAAGDRLDASRDAVVAAERALKGHLQGVWTPSAAVLCLPCHGPKFVRHGKTDIVPEDDLRRRVHPEGDEVLTVCDECGEEILVGRDDVAALNNLRYDVDRALWYSKVVFGVRMEQTGGMCAALCVSLSDGSRIMLTDAETGGPMRFGMWRYESDEDEEGHGILEPNADLSADEVVAFFLSLDAQWSSAKRRGKAHS